MANNIPELILKDISVEDGKKILDVSNLPTVTMCATLEKVFIDSDECPGIYKITDKKIGNESSYGSIFLTCCESEEKVGKFTLVSNNCDYVAKWQPIIDLGAGFKTKATIMEHTLVLPIRPSTGTWRDFEKYTKIYDI